MKVMTQLGPLSINPADVVSLKPAPVIPETVGFYDLTHIVDLDDRFCSMGDLTVCISEEDAERLSELSGIGIEFKKEKKSLDYPQYSDLETYRRRNIFVPFQKRIVLNEWEKHFKESIAWKQGKSQEPDSRTQPAPTSFYSGCKIPGNGDWQPTSLIERALQEQGKGPDESGLL
jgi:hypothetical protein